MPTAATGVGTGTSSLAMVTCCLPHVTDVLPMLGLSGVAVFLNNYRVPFMVGGLAVNGMGVVVMLRVVLQGRAHLKALRVPPYRRRSNCERLQVDAPASLRSAAVPCPDGSGRPGVWLAGGLYTLRRGGVAFQATVVTAQDMAERGHPPDHAGFLVQLDTHSRNLLDYDLTELAALRDDTIPGPPG